MLVAGGWCVGLEDVTATVVPAKSPVLGETRDGVLGVAPSCGLFSGWTWPLPVCGFEGLQVHSGVLGWEAAGPWCAGGFASSFRCCAEVAAVPCVVGDRRWCHRCWRMPRPTCACPG